MNPQNSGYDLNSFVDGYLLKGIEKHGLSIGKDFGGTVTLSNVNCIISVQNFGEGVDFFIASMSSPNEKYAISDYLNSIKVGGDRQYFPALPEETSIRERFAKTFQSFNEVLLSNALDAPMSGDFSWAPKLVADRLEYRTLEGKMFILIEFEHPEGMAIREKWAQNDITWMDDVRRILAEQESQS